VPPPEAAAHRLTIRRLDQATGWLGTHATTRMDETLPWYRDMPAEDRSWVSVIAQAGIAAFVEWFSAPGRPQKITADVFGIAPRELARAISLQQTLDMLRTTIAVVEENSDALAAPGDETWLREAVLRYSREVAFAAAEVYAAAAEARGAWDARLEALVIDALVRGEVDEGVVTRAAALGWNRSNDAVVVVGTAPPGKDTATVVDTVQRAARNHRIEPIAGCYADTLIVVLGGAKDPESVVRHLIPHFGRGPVVIGPSAPDLERATVSAAAALAGLRAAVAWPDAPRPVLADALLPERALAGDPIAREHLVRDVYDALHAEDPALALTAATYLERAPGYEAAARALFVHPNTVRYRLRRVAEVTGLTVTDPRQALTLRLALVFGRLAQNGRAL